MCAGSGREKMNDTERLDWLESNYLVMSIVLRYIDGHFNVRDAIDTAAMARSLDSETMRRAYELALVRQAGEGE